jgi:hypothetical protein
MFARTDVHDYTDGPGSRPPWSFRGECLRLLTQEPDEKPQQSLLRRGGRADFVTPSSQITADMLGRRASSSHPPRSQSEMPEFSNRLPVSYNLGFNRRAGRCDPQGFSGSRMTAGGMFARTDVRDYTDGPGAPAGISRHGLDENAKFRITQRGNAVR